MNNYKTYFWRGIKNGSIINLLILLIIYIIDGWSSGLYFVFALICIKFYIPFGGLIINYMYFDKKYEFNFENNKTIRLVHNNETMIITRGDISLIEVNMSYPKFNNTYSFFLWDRLFYYKLVLKNNTNIFIST